MWLYLLNFKWTSHIVAYKDAVGHLKGDISKYFQGQCLFASQSLVEAPSTASKRN